MKSIAETARKWDLNGHSTQIGLTFNQIHERLEFFDKHQYKQYLPTQGSNFADYEARLEKWLDNVVGEQDKQLLFQLALEIIFFTKEDFTKLYQAALRGPITRWLMDIKGYNLTTADLNQKLDHEIHRSTWFCPITDSMPISEFHHANNIGGIDYRPDWRFLVIRGKLQILWPITPRLVADHHCARLYYWKIL
jgi:broad specificity phosphatase PhoE